MPLKGIAWGPWTDAMQSPQIGPIYLRLNRSAGLGPGKGGSTVSSLPHPAGWRRLAYLGPDSRCPGPHSPTPAWKVKAKS